MDIQCTDTAIERLIGDSAPIRHVRDTIRVAAAFPSTVLIHGESGTGKELIARAIHEESPRAAGPFVTVDCTVLTESLFESLLFGHEKGSFSGAITSTEGLVRTADGGTLFLDELGELRAPEQAKLLRLLQERTVLPVGSTRQIPVDIRVVAATHRNLAAMVEEGRFRKDLFYRLDVVRISTPALRERAQDIPAIARDIVDRLGALFGVHRELSPEALEALLLCSWPGNVRQLATCIERAAVLSQDEVIQPCHLRLETSAARETEPNLLERSTAETIRFVLKSAMAIGPRRHGAWASIGGSCTG
ncbi:MAG: sigma 54-interacting transcriptional regulator [Phycisphaeraceae bacterium]|nr:sigma 54-interacting transcriptional regulator [Phycisphaeraceae bacterium]